MPLGNLASDADRMIFHILTVLGLRNHRVLLEFDLENCGVPNRSTVIARNYHLSRNLEIEIPDDLPDGVSYVWIGEGPAARRDRPNIKEVTKSVFYSCTVGPGTTPSQRVGNAWSPNQVLSQWKIEHVTLPEDGNVFTGTLLELKNHLNIGSAAINYLRGN